jgi:hypothetical protein
MAKVLVARTVLSFIFLLAQYNIFFHWHKLTGSVVMARLLNDGTTASALEHVFRPIKEAKSMEAGIPSSRYSSKLYISLAKSPEIFLFTLINFHDPQISFHPFISLRSPPPVIDHSQFD